MAKLHKYNLFAPNLYLKSITAKKQSIGREGLLFVEPVVFGLSVKAPKMDRRASVVWKGSLREGAGTMSTESGVLRDTQYSFGTRFESGIGTNPDELIAASLCGCFSMALSKELGLCGFRAERIETAAVATIEELKVGWTLTRIQLDVRATVPDVSQDDFIDAALAAKTRCPMARLLKTNISMMATLDS